MVVMNIQGVTMTAPVMPAPQAQGAAPLQSPEGAQGAESLNLSSAVSTQVLDMAQSQFEDAASQLIDQMAAMTGVGQSIDMQV